MSPESSFFIADFTSVPRASGDEPGQYLFGGPAYACSPRERG